MRRTSLIAAAGAAALVAVAGLLSVAPAKGPEGRAGGSPASDDGRDDAGVSRAGAGDAGADDDGAAPLPAFLAETVASGTHWRFDPGRGPVHAWIPPGYQHETAGIVVYVHGYYTDVDRAFREHRLAEQFHASGRNALFIVPEAPARRGQRVHWPDLGHLLREVRRRTGLHRPWGPVVAIGHSGAYRTLLAWLEYPPLQHVILLDALYGHEPPFRRWLAGPAGSARPASAPARRLTLVAIDTLRWSEPLAREIIETARVDAARGDTARATLRGARPRASTLRGARPRAPPRTRPGPPISATPGRPSTTPSTGFPATSPSSTPPPGAAASSTSARSTATWRWSPAVPPSPCCSPPATCRRSPPSRMDTLTLYLPLAGAGVAAGFINAVAGGGSLLTLPALMLLGLPADMANGTNRVAILGQSIAGVLGFRRHGQLELAGAARVVAPTVLGAALGATAASRLPADLLEYVLLGLMMAMAVLMVIRPRVMAGDESAAPPTPRRRRLGALGLFAAGAYGGFAQAGVGILLLFVLGGVLRHDLVRANALKLSCVTVFCAVALAIFVAAGQVEWLPGLVLMVFAVAGSLLGVRFAIRAAPRTLRWIVFACVMATCVAVLVRP